MIKVICDTCGVVKDHSSRNHEAATRAAQPEWIMGYDLQSSTPRAVSRSMSFFDHWEPVRILERGAIHFCSLVCKEAYIDANSPTRRKEQPRKKAARRKHKAAA